MKSFPPSPQVAQGELLDGDRPAYNSAMQQAEQDQFRFPPYQYRTSLCVQDRKGNIRLPDIEEREVLMGFPRGYTVNCLPKSKRHGSQWTDERLSLIGNSWCVFVIAWLLYCLGVPRGLCNAMPLSKLMRQCKPGGGTVLQGFLLRPYMRVPSVPVAPVQDGLIRKLSGLISGKGEGLLLQAPSEDVQRTHRLQASIPSNLWCLADHLWVALAWRQRTHQWA